MVSGMVPAALEVTVVASVSEVLPATLNPVRVPTPVMALYVPPARSLLPMSEVVSNPAAVLCTTPTELSPEIVTFPAELMVTKLVPVLDWKSAILAAVPVVSFTVRPVTPSAVGATVFWPVLPGTSTRQTEHDEDDQVG